MHIAFITAGGAGMFCGSCMQDNAVARAMMKLDCEVSLIPTYTPIRVDEQNVSSERVFLGGINLYLDHKIPFWRYLPEWLVSWLDRPRLLKWATSFGIDNDAAALGSMTLDMLHGADGTMQREYAELVRFLTKQLKPDAIVFSNALLSGVMPMLREEYQGPVYCLLQGDDLFLDQLPGRFQTEVKAHLATNTRHFDGYITHSQFYADYMSSYLDLPREKFQHIPLSIDLPTDQIPSITDKFSSEDRPVRIGYFARIAPEKGLLELVQAGLHLQKLGAEFEILAGGYLAPAQKTYFSKIQATAEPLGARFQYLGSPDSQVDKLKFYQQLDLFSVPAIFNEPKGLYLLEAMGMGIPVVQPDSASYPELIASTAGGVLFAAGDPEQHAKALLELINDTQTRKKLALAGQAAVEEKHSSIAAGRKLLEICQQEK